VDKNKWNIFYAGILFYASINSIIQDIMGKEGYINYVNLHWIDSSVTFPLAIVLLFLSFSLIKLNRY